jgi:phospholipase/carboxylesterase
MNVAWRAATGPGSDRPPLIVLFHGRGADEQSLLDLAALLPQRFAAALPRGPIALGSGGYTWFENRGLGRPQGPSLRASVDGMQAWLDALDPARFDLTRVIVGGFSAGMLFGGALLLDRPARFYAGILLSGTLPWEIAEIVPSANRLAGKPVFHAHGDRDDVIPLDLVARSEAYLIGESGAALEHRRYPIAHEISAAEQGDLNVWLEALPR